MTERVAMRMNAPGPFDATAVLVITGSAAVTSLLAFAVLMWREHGAAIWLDAAMSFCL